MNLEEQTLVAVYVYLGEKVVSEKEYRSAMVGYVGVLQVGEDVQATVRGTVVWRGGRRGY
jgi:hypothetical protein